MELLSVQQVGLGNDERMRAQDLVPEGCGVRWSLAKQEAGLNSPAYMKNLRAERYAKTSSMKAASSALSFSREGLCKYIMCPAS